MSSRLDDTMLSDAELSALLETAQTTTTTTRRMVVSEPLAPTPAPMPKPTAKSAVKTFDLSGLAGKAEDKPKGKTQYPKLLDPEVKDMATTWLKYAQQAEALEGAMEALRRDIINVALPFHFRNNQGKAEVAGTVSVPTDEGEVLVQCKNAYKKMTQAQLDKLQGILGAQLTSQHFRQKIEFKLDSDKIPEAKMQAVINELAALVEQHGIAEAFSCKAVFVPNDTWHSARYALAPSVNQDIERAIDPEKGFMTVAVTQAKGRRKK